MIKENECMLKLNFVLPIHKKAEKINYIMFQLYIKFNVLMLKNMKNQK